MVQANQLRWHKRIRQTLDIARGKSIKLDVNVQTADDRAPTNPKTLIIFEARDDDAAPNTRESASDMGGCPASDALDRSSDETMPNVAACATDLIVEVSQDKDVENNGDPPQSDPTPMPDNAKEEKKTQESREKQETEEENQNTIKLENQKREEHEERGENETKQGNAVDGSWLLPEGDAIGLTDNIELICNERSLSNVSYNTIRTEYNVAPKIPSVAEGQKQSDPDVKKEQTSYTEGLLKTLFCFPREDDTSEEVIDDTLSHFVIHNVQNDLRKGKTGRVLKQKEVGGKVLLRRINDIKKIIAALEVKKSENALHSKYGEENDSLESVNAKIEAMVTTLEMQIKAIAMESRQLDLKMGRSANNDIDSVVMDMTLSPYAVVNSMETEDSEDTIADLVSRLFSCRAGKGGSSSFSPTISMASTDSESVAEEEALIRHGEKYEF